jgi:hypothetical protein
VGLTESDKHNLEKVREMVIKKKKPFIMIFILKELLEKIQ